jgi:hypothetical protein
LLPADLARLRLLVALLSPIAVSVLLWLLSFYWMPCSTRRRLTAAPRRR